MLIYTINKKEGISILMVTHDAKIASYSTKLLYIKDGIIDTQIERRDLSQKELDSKSANLTNNQQSLLHRYFGLRNKKQVLTDLQNVTGNEYNDGFVVDLAVLETLTGDREEYENALQQRAEQLKSRTEEDKYKTLFPL